MKFKFIVFHLTVFIMIALVSFGILPGDADVEASTPFPAGSRKQEARPFCSNPTSENLKHCLETERAILASTVRIEFFWDELDDEYSGAKQAFSATSHGTIKDGRYLLTHNHFGSKLSGDLKGRKKNIRFSLYTAKGETIQEYIPLLALSIRIEEAETLVLDIGQYASDETGQIAGKGLFELLSLPSAQFKSWPSADLKIGDEVAQVHWDGTRTFVNWVIIEDIKTEEHLSTLSLASLPQQGSSGGGVFWNGYHIGNTWAQALMYDTKNGKPIGHYSTAVLNSPAVIASLDYK